MSLLGKIVRLVQNDTHLSLGIVTHEHDDGSVDVSTLPVTHTNVQVGGEAKPDQVVVDSAVDADSDVDTNSKDESVNVNSNSNSATVDNSNPLSTGPVEN